MIYLSIVMLGLIVLYFGYAWLLPKLGFNQSQLPGFKSASSIIIFAIFSAIIFYLSFVIPNPIVANRLLHSIGGGFAGILVCFLSVKDYGLQMNRLQFFILSALTITALGVGNEIFECILQNYLGYISAETINDTWLDLISNTGGIILALAIFTPFIGKKK